MTHYEKLTVERFEQNLKDKKYDTLTGARRAIGKTSSWNEKEKEKARGIALKHFGGEAPSAPKAAKKVGGKAPPKKASIKFAVLPSVPTVSKVGGKIGAKKAAKRIAAAAPDARQHAPSAPSGPEPRSASEAIQLGNELVSFAGSLREGAKLVKGDSPSMNMGHVMEEVSSLLLRAGRLVSRHIEGAQELPPARVAVNSPVHVHAEKEYGVGSTLEVSVLTPSEQHMADALKNAQPVSSIGALPRPVAQPTS